jgi:cysteinyl-tRNA synthetase
MDLEKKLYLFNTLTKKKELFEPIHTGSALMYHCGPTVYWVQHIGNMRAVYFADIVVRTLKATGYKTTLVRNYTDVGHLTGDNIGDADTGIDRMEKASRSEGLLPDEIADKYIHIYTEDIDKLHTLPADIAPKATHHIDDMVAMIQTLIEKGYAYTCDEAVYFDISKAACYTRLSGQKIENLLVGSGHGVTRGNGKKHPGDFALWFFKTGPHKNALQTWKSPFVSPLVSDGEGFPGWHIECSAMSLKYLGKHFDIHIGGIEHIPIHHTNEIAQSESANESPFVNYWLHNEHLLVDGAKMSKSDGTSYTMSDIVEHGYSPRDLRFFFLQAHYRSKQNFTWEALGASQSALSKIDNYIQDSLSAGTCSNVYISKFYSYIYDDFNTSAALAIIFEMMKDKSLTKDDFLATLLQCDRVLGLSFQETLAAQKNTATTEIPSEIINLAKKRQKAKEDKNWDEADRLRTTIEEMGYIILDSKEGFSISLKTK